jgi:prefoldin subunit 5
MRLAAPGGRVGVRTQWVVSFMATMLAIVLGAALLSPAPAGAVAREIVELQQDVQQLIQGQKTLQTVIAQQSAVQKTLIELSLDSVSKRSGTMGTVETSVRDMRANSGAKLDTMSTQMQAISESLQEVQARMGKLNQQLTDAQASIQSIDAKVDCSMSVPNGKDSKR